MTKDLATARLIFYVMAGSFLFSAALLGYFRLTGKAVPTSILVGWAGLGAVAFAVTPLLTLDRRWAAWLLVVILGPWMAFSLVQDLRQKIYPIAATDMAGLAAIAYGTYLACRGG